MIISETRVFKFKQFYTKFLKIDKYMREKRLRSDLASENWKEVEKNFWDNSVKPLENVWAKLTKDEKEQFCVQMGWSI